MTPDHQCLIVLTGDRDWPYQAKCKCGWKSIGYPLPEPAGDTATEHCQFHNDYNPDAAGTRTE